MSLLPHHCIREQKAKHTQDDGYGREHQPQYPYCFCAEKITQQEKNDSKAEWNQWEPPERTHAMTHHRSHHATHRVITHGFHHPWHNVVHHGPFICGAHTAAAFPHDATDPVRLVLVACIYRHGACHWFRYVHISPVYLCIDCQSQHSPAQFSPYFVSSIAIIFSATSRATASRSAWGTSVYRKRSEYFW